MRDFNNADRDKKRRRIRLPENPGNLSQPELSALEEKVRASLRDGYLPCPAAWKIARDARVPRVTVGEMTDRLSVRVTDCQIGCFKVAKTPYDGTAPQAADDEIAGRVVALDEQGELTCAGVFELARQMQVKPMQVADTVNIRGLKIRQCQLGCF